MPSDGVVEPFDVVEYRGAGLVAGPEAGPVEEFRFEPIHLHSVRDTLPDSRHRRTRVELTNTTAALPLRTTTTISVDQPVVTLDNTGGSGSSGGSSNRRAPS